MSTYWIHIIEKHPRSNSQLLIVLNDLMVLFHEAIFQDSVVDLDIITGPIDFVYYLHQFFYMYSK